MNKKEQQWVIVEQVGGEKESFVSIIILSSLVARDI